MSGPPKIWLQLALVAIPGLLWLGLDSDLGNRLAEALPSRWAVSIAAKSQGRIVDGQRFLRCRLRDAAMLTSTLGGLLLAGTLLRRFLARRTTPLLAWMPLTVYTFLAVNCWLAIACRTALFWGALFAAHPNLKQAHFHLGQTLLAESARPVRAVVTGSSQGVSQIDCGLLNQRLAPQVEFANMSYAGSSAFDLLLIQRQFLPLQPRLVICYLSERNIYHAGEGGVGSFIPFLSPGGVRDLGELDPQASQRANDVMLGCLARALPTFRTRRAIELALLGGEAGDAKAAHRARSFESTSEHDRLVQIAQKYRLDERCDVQKQALRRFVERNRQHGVQSILVLGQVSPALEQVIDPAVRADFRQFVLSLDGGATGATRVLSELPRHEASAYLHGDAMHVIDAERQRFTESLASALDDILAALPP